MKGIIFDLDGVIVNSETIRFFAVKQTFKDIFGVNLPDNDKTWVGRDERTNMNYFMNMFNLKGNVDKIIQQKRDNYSKLIESGKLSEVDGSIDFLKAVCKSGLKTALVSNSPKEEVENVISFFKIKSYFDAILSKEDVVEPKPNPEIYLKALKDLGLKPEECIAIEDSPPGVDAAKSAGLKCVAITTTANKDNLKNADLVIKNFSDLKCKMKYL